MRLPRRRENRCAKALLPFREKKCASGREGKTLRLSSAICGEGLADGGTMDCARRGRVGKGVNES